MNLSNATNKQLITITNYDRECPKELMEQIVMEMLERGAFKSFTLHITKGFTFSDMTPDELEQFGNIAIWEALKAYKPGKASFVNLAKQVLLRKIYNYLDYQNVPSRKINTFAMHLEEQPDINELLPDKTNVERYVLHRLHLQQQLNILTPIQKAAVIGYMKGYTFREIAIQTKKHRQNVERAFHTAVEKMGGERITFKQGMKGA